MNLLIDIGHPAHVHYFRNLYFILREKHNIIVTCKSYPVIVQLLNYYQIPYVSLGDRGASFADKLKLQLVYTLKMRAILKQHSIDIAFGSSALIVHAAKFTKAVSILFDDDDQAPQPITAKFITPYADTILSPDVLEFEQLKRAIYYPGYHELAYLHPNWYKPNPLVLNKYGLSENDRYAILRFSALKAHHDVGAVGISITQKRSLIKALSEYGKVFITMEATLDAEFEPYRMPIEPHEMHDFLHYAQVLVCDGQTMCTEASLLGVPSFRCNSFAGRVSILEEEELKYGLTYAFLPRQFDWMVNRLRAHLDNKDIKENWRERREQLLSDKIDVTSFWAWFINNYPSSSIEVKKPEFDFREFK